jgi:hypothetical protein
LASQPTGTTRAGTEIPKTGSMPVRNYGATW